jgi:hypothetical protein
MEVSKMKAKHFKIMRKRVNDRVWLQKELWKIANVFHDLKNFYRFECSEFFRGGLKAKINLEIHNSNYKKAIRKQHQIEWLMKRITVNGGE